MYDMFSGMGWGWMGLGMAPVGLFWILVILGIIFLAKWLIGGPSPGKDAIEILKARYVRGELTRDQFEQMKKDIDS